MNMVDILRQYIRAECTGNWALHLECISKMLPYQAASGHNHYTKSAWVYLQRMSQLEEQHPDIYQQFQEGLHVVRRSDRLWAGLSTDLVIEQVLMTSMKTSGGLTSHILFLHAILGCDTTSQPHGIGKGNSLKKFRDCDHLRDLAEAFNSPSATTEEISTAGEQVLFTIYI